MSLTESYTTDYYREFWRQKLRVRLEEVSFGELRRKEQKQEEPHRGWLPEPASDRRR